MAGRNFGTGDTGYHPKRLRACWQIQMVNLWQVQHFPSGFHRNRQHGTSHCLVFLEHPVEADQYTHPGRPILPIPLNLSSQSPASR